jgi:hypothetical protein
MQKPFVSQPELFVTTSDLDHPALHALGEVIPPKISVIKSRIFRQDI